MIWCFTEKNSERNAKNLLIWSLWMLRYIVPYYATSRRLLIGFSLPTEWPHGRVSVQVCIVRSLWLVAKLRQVCKTSNQHDWIFCILDMSKDFQRHIFGKIMKFSTRKNPFFSLFCIKINYYLRLVHIWIWMDGEIERHADR